MDTKILLIDDDEEVLLLTKHVLSNLGYTKVTITTDAQQAVRRIRSGTIDLVLCDWYMPDVAGIDILRIVRATNTIIPFIMLTSEKKKNRVIEAMQAGATSYLIKPYTEVSLQTAIDKAVGSKES